MASTASSTCDTTVCSEAGAGSGVTRNRPGHAQNQIFLKSRISKAHKLSNFDKVVLEHADGHHNAGGNHPTYAEMNNALD